MIQLLNRLTAIMGASGGEDGVRDAIKSEIIEHCDELYTDALGNLIAHKKGNGKKLMFAAHMDQIGMVITYIEKEGVLRFAPIGGLRPHTILHQRVRLENGIRGIVTVGDKKETKDLKLEDMYIDIGSKSKEDAEKVVPIGSQVVYESSFYSNDEWVISNALDDRAGCAVLVKAMQSIEKYSNDLYFVFTVQEELGLRGAKTAAFAIEPDYAIAVDVTASGNIPDGYKMAVEVGKGPAVKIRDNYLMAHPFVKALLIDTAVENKIPYQLEVLEFGGTDAGAIHVSRSGVPSGALSIPVRYVHTPSESASIKDIELAVNLIKAVAEKAL